MATHGWMLCALSAILFFSGAILAAVEEVQDFDFDDDAEVKVVKRSVDTPGLRRVVLTDEDIMLADEMGSGPDEGSGEIPTEPTSRYYRVSVNIPGLTYLPGFQNLTDPQFRLYADRITFAIQEAFGRQLEGQFDANVYALERSSAGFGTKASLDMFVMGQLTESDVKNTWGRFTSGALPAGEFRFDSRDFSFKLLEGRPVCPDFVGREPTSLATKGDNWANLLVNNVFPCAGQVIGWEYYRTQAEGTVYVGVWSLRPNSDFVLVDKTELPPAPVGIVRVDLEKPIPVGISEFIGIFYSKDAPSNVVAKSLSGDGIVSAEQLYQNYRIQIFNEDIQQGQAYSVDDYQLQSENATFGLRAVMEYPEDGSVVTGIICGAEEFDCGSGVCVPDAYRCDGQSDCRNSADEINCEICQGNAHNCGDGTCLARDFLCDGNSDCENNSDEANCPPVGRCQSDEFQCVVTKACVSVDQRCDGISDCGDGTDESDCPPVDACTVDEFQCLNGDCISRDLVCDSRPDCGESEDELGCTECDPETEFRCTDSKRCIPKTDMCNSIPDCADFSDELDDSCRTDISTGPPPCNEGDFRCPSGVCIEPRQVCDGTEDCFGGADEQNCAETEACRVDQYRCEDGQCINGTLTCDGFADCNDFSDEISCQLEIDGPPGEVDVGRRHLITCNATGGGGIPPNIYWFLDPAQGGRRVNLTDLFLSQPNPREGPFFIRELRRRTHFFTELYVMSVRPQDAGVYTCYVSERLASRYELRVAIQACETGEFQCADLERCIDDSWRCDGTQDCRDGSDEANCDTCRRDEFTCRNKRCIPSGEKCDRKADCSDGSDEEGCPCAEDEFTCADGSCIRGEYRCDRRPDCPDQSDERDCSRCRSTEFECASGECVDARYRCNRNRDCVDSSDEFNCNCTSQEFRCVTNGQCIAQSDVCNSVPDCVDRSDESDC
ncbi:hypothetical protein EGW08_004887, partial [Elysia chlorotica]